ncbi:MAG: hypothetical protein ACFFDO_03915 [Candidatus Thorarchaeota archaeon]
MLYTIFLYQQESGLLLYDKSFQDISDGKLDLFSSFFSTLKSFVSEVVLEGSQELKNIELGNYSVFFTAINEIKTDLVIIADNEDYKLVNKLIPKFIKILIDYKEIFLNWEGIKADFDILNTPISELIQSQKKLIGDKSLIEKPDLVLKSIWAHKKDLSLQEKENLIQEKDLLLSKLEKITNIQRKLGISKKLLEISERLKDEQGFFKYQEDVKLLKDNLKDTKIKLKYYLERIKLTLSQAIKLLGTKSVTEGSYRDVYLNLYSFSNKLKNITTDTKWREYQNLAKLLINKEEVSAHELSVAITKILHMNDDIDYYLN